MIDRNDPAPDENDHAVVEGIFLVYNSWARIRFDSRATQSFISTSFTSILGLESETMSSPLVIGSLMGNSVEVNTLCKSCFIEILNHRLVFDLIILEMLEYDVILGMDWLTHFNAIIDCGKKRVTIKIPDGETFSFHGIGNKVKPKFILDIRECSYLNLITSIAMEIQTTFKWNSLL